MEMCTSVRRTSRKHQAGINRRHCAALVLLLALAARPAQGAGIVVNSLADGSVVGACTLRDAVAAANTDAAVSGCTPGAGDDTITFSVSGTITLTANALAISQGSVTVDGSGQAVTVSGGGVYGVLFVSGGATLRLEQMTVANGHATQPVLGGGVFVSSGATFSASRATFTSNSAKDGGAIYTSGTVNIINSTFSGNSATTGGGISVATSATGSLTIANSTFSGNSAGSGGGLLNGKTATVVNSTFSENRSSIDAGGGILNYGTLNVANTIIANSTAGGDCANSLPGVTGTINAGVNLIEDGSCAGPGTLTGDPVLGSLVDNGGPTKTHALTTASTLAIDKGDNTVCATYATDQRGAPRKVDGDVNGSAVCDLGAYELGPWTATEGVFTSLVVTHTADTDDGVCDADCSLREALAVATADLGAETITFAIPTSDPGYDAATGAHTITLTGPLSVPSGKVTVTGPGAARLAISGNQAVRIFTLANADVTLANLTIRDAFDDGLEGSFGAAIDSSESILNVVSCQFLENFGDFKSNGGIRASDGVLNVSNTVFFANGGVKDGGAIELHSGAVANVANSTFSNNFGNRGGALFVEDGTTMNLSSSTLYANTSGGGKWGVYVGGTITMRNSIVTQGSPLCIDSGGTLTGANNLIDDDSCGNDPSFRVGAVTNFDTTLQNNGGPTTTHALLADSNAIDAVPAGQCTFLSSGTNPLFANGAAIPTDQRGVARPQGTACDIGAFELVLNRPPAPVNDSFATSPNTPLAVAAPGVLTNDTDPDGNTLEAFLVSGPSHGTVLLSPNGAFTYTPVNGYLGSDAFTYKATDGQASTNASAKIAISAPTCGIDVQPATLAQPYVAMAYLQLLGATPSGKYTFSLTAGALPPGLQLASAFGVSGLIGIPQSPGTYTFTITAAKTGTDCRASRTYTVTIAPTVVPLLTCVQKITSTTYRATFGFASSMAMPVSIPVGANNYFTPGAQNRGQVTAFAPGTAGNAFTVTFTANKNDTDLAVWFLRGPDNQKRLVTVTKSTYNCQ